MYQQVKPGFTNYQPQPSSLGPEVKYLEEEQKKENPKRKDRCYKFQIFKEVEGINK